MPRPTFCCDIRGHPVHPLSPRPRSRRRVHPPKRAELPRDVRPLRPTTAEDHAVEATVCGTHSILPAPSSDHGVENAEAVNSVETEDGVDCNTGQDSQTPNTIPMASALSQSSVPRLPSIKSDTLTFPMGIEINTAITPVPPVPPMPAMPPFSGVLQRRRPLPRSIARQTESTGSDASLHLFNMRISQHLRSLSAFSGQSATDTAVDGSPDSIGNNNMEEAAETWTKAFGTWQDRAEDRRRSQSGSSGSRSSRGSKPALSEKPRPESATQMRSLAAPHASHRLAVPGKDRSGSISSANDEKTQSEKAPSPEPLHSTLFRKPGFDKPKTPHIFITDTDTGGESQAYYPQQPTDSSSRSSMGSWFRYPLHSKAQRVGSAGSSDSMTVRDFAARDSDDDEEDPLEDKHSPTKQRSRAKRVSLRKKLFVDIPKILKPRSVGFHKGESRHRSSIAAGGTLKYPELELVGGGGIEYEPSVLDSSGRRASVEDLGTDDRSKTAAETDGAPSPTVRPSALASARQYRQSSSRYGSSSGREADAIEAAEASNTWSMHTAAEYSELVADEAQSRQPTGNASERDLSRLAAEKGSTTQAAEKGSTIPLDGIAEGQATGWSNTLPPRFSTKRKEASLERRRFSASLESHPIRQSTQDFLRLLDNSEEAARLKALETAEKAWA